jgi:hypothetical protein
MSNTRAEGAHPQSIAPSPPLVKRCDDAVCTYLIQVPLTLLVLANGVATGVRYAARIGRGKGSGAT